VEARRAVFAVKLASASRADLGARLVQLSTVAGGTPKMFTSMLLQCPSQISDAVDMAWERCHAAAKLATRYPPAAAEAAKFIDAHFPLIAHGTTCPQIATPLALIPGDQISTARRCFAKWESTIWESMSDHGAGTNPAVRVIQKGSPVVTSVRYIGSQLRKASMSETTGPDAQVLQDILRTHVLGTWHSAPIVDPKERYRRWSMPPADLYNEFGAPLRSMDIKRIVLIFTQGIAGMDPGLFYAMRTTYQRPLTALLALRTLSRAVAGSAQSPAMPTVGFSMCVPADHPLTEAYTGLSGPSAKRIKSIINTTSGKVLAEVTRATSSIGHPIYEVSAAALDADQAAAELAQPWVYVLICTACGDWRSKIVNPKGNSGVVIDLDTCLVVCATCTKPQLYRLRLNGVQIRARGNYWVRMCNKCKNVVRVLPGITALHSNSVLCDRCTRIAPLPSCACGRVTVRRAIGKHPITGEYIEVAACVQHRANLPLAPDTPVHQSLLQ